jgi:pimeloyl-ACP methyl ester carboxylesterase
MLKRILSVFLAVIILLPLSGAVYQAVATALDKRSYPPPGQLVDVGGYRLHLYCTGETRDGRPTVVLETGLGGFATSPDWAWVQPEVAKTTRVCAYDRAGLGWSDPGPGPRDAHHIAAELHTLLQNAHTPGPYVLVGWSYGGLYVRAYANQYRGEVSGLVLIDSTSPEQCTSSPAWQAQCAASAKTASTARLLARIGGVRVFDLFQPATGLPGLQNQELFSFNATSKDWDEQVAEFRASSETNAQVLSAAPFVSIPLYILTATDHGGQAELEQSWQVWQSGYTALSTNSVQKVVPGATHASFVFSPTVSRITDNAILQVVEAARTGKQLTP